MRTKTLLIGTLLMLTGCGGNADSVMNPTETLGNRVLDSALDPPQDILDCDKVGKGSVDNSEKVGVSGKFKFFFFDFGELDIGSTTTRKQDCNDYSETETAKKKKTKPNWGSGRFPTEDIDPTVCFGRSDEINCLRSRKNLCQQRCQAMTGLYTICWECNDR